MKTPKNRRTTLLTISTALGTIFSGTFSVPIVNAATKPTDSGAKIIAVRLWPAKDYTRVTIESDKSLKTTHIMVSDPPRLAVDIQDLILSQKLKEIVAKVKSDDPNVSGIRVGQNTPTVVRLVIDLKHPTNPQVFTLTPVAAYKNRLVFDLYPANPPDPLEQIIAERLGEMGEISPQTPPQIAKITPQSPSNDPIADLIAQKAAQEQYQAQSQNKTAPIYTPPYTPPQIAKVTPPKQKTPTQTPSTPAIKKTTGITRKVTAQRLIIVALDPGHGGEDPGAIGPAGTYEKTVVLQIAQRLRKKINASQIAGNPMRAYMTRDADYFVPLATRVQKARAVNADLFISIHADAFMRPEARGASIYALSQRGASSTAARWLANKENQSDQIGGVNLGAKDASIQRVLLEMSTSVQIRDSMNLGHAMLREMKGVGNLHKPKVEQANFAVLRAPDIPSVLVETAFISNPQEEKNLRSAAYQEQIANALMTGIKRYFAANPPLARNRAI